MTDLDPETRRILSLARAARTPSAADKRRVQRRLAVGAAASVAAASSAAVAHAAQGSAAIQVMGVVGSLKLYLAAGVLLLSAASGYVLLSPPTAPARPTPPVAAVTAARPTPPAIDPEPLETPFKPAVAAPAPPPRAATQRESRGSASLASELDLLHSAQAAWRSRDSERTLSLLDQHARQYPHSELREERGALRVLALCELGRNAEARRLGRALIRHAPHSPMRTTIEESCALP